MLRLTLAVLCVAAAVSASGLRRGPLPVPKAEFHKIVDERIVGGEAATEGQFPYQVSFRYQAGFHFCGGAIYNDRTVITASHCCDGQDPSAVKIVAGELLKSVDSGYEQEVNVESITMHPEYNVVASFDSDICILGLSSPLEFNDYVGAVPMPDQDEEFTGEAVVSGWGTISSGGSTPDELRYVTVPLVDDETCAEDYSSSYEITKTMICAGEEGKDSCQGDSGGPMTCKGEKHCGIVSWGIGCAAAGYPGVYAKTAVFVDWIASVASY